MILDKELKQNGICNTCEIETGNKYYIFCSKECQEVWYTLKERFMGKYDVDIELYKTWLAEKTQTIDSMNSIEEIEARVIEVGNIKFYANREWALLHERYDKLTGRKGIAPWIKAERDNLIDPEFKLPSADGEPREKKPKAKKEDLVKGLLDMDLKEMIADMKGKKEPNGKAEDKPKKESKPKEMTMDELIAKQILNKPKEEPKKATAEEIKAKADSMRERLRLAREKKENPNG